MKLTVIYGTETGNCKGVAAKVAKKAEKNGVEIEVLDFADYDVDQLASIDNPLLIIISTWDDGAPPPKCVESFNKLMAREEALTNLHYTVLALGDTEYPLFCECGKQVDAKLSELGATKLLERTDLGSEFMVTYIGWSKRFWKTLAGVFGKTA
ncbi:flavodoxin domain-containing protein [Pelagicoccus albus]|uniref:Flavodoxin domain-containing protein n=1 Tax=Pelagicoccus albus TaxID=415222 RepID=A0A7X1B611_9BACT|nr:flavodoxin domain-containing protein [Pelagicoccus albus]MBC2606182.1 flavodoxin domain-containing protein [Pelagicoccus albus]